MNQTLGSSWLDDILSGSSATQGHPSSSGNQVYSPPSVSATRFRPPATDAGSQVYSTPPSGSLLDDLFANAPPSSNQYPSGSATQVYSPSGSLLDDLFANAPPSSNQYPSGSATRFRKPTGGKSNRRKARKAANKSKRSKRYKRKSAAHY
jgi:hypothetical protein